MSNTASKKTLILMIVVFVLPVVFAKLALDHDWFNRAATNNGTLIQPTINLSSVLEGTQPKWRLLFVLPEYCDQQCENALFSINQVWLALGKEADRAQALVLYNEKSDGNALQKLSEYENVKTLSVDETDLKLLETRNVYIVDTLNNAMLFYRMDSDRKTAVMESRNMLADIKKLLKLSRIG